MNTFFRPLRPLGLSSFVGVSLMSSLVAAAEPTPATVPAPAPAPATVPAPASTPAPVSTSATTSAPAKAPALAGGDAGLRWQITPYVLAANITGDVSMGRASGVPVGVDFGQILDHLEVGGMVHGEVWYQRFGFLGEVVGMKLSDTVTATGPAGQTGLTADIEVTEVVYEAAFAYRLTANERLTADVIVGARIWDLGTKVDLSGAYTESGISQDELWVDPLVGARGLWQFADRWSLIGRGDIGGFALGADFAWNLSANVGFEAARWCTLVLGYRALGVDYNNEEGGSEAFAYETITYGVELGAAFTF